MATGRANPRLMLPTATGAIALLFHLLIWGRATFFAPSFTFVLSCCMSACPQFQSVSRVLHFLCYQTFIIPLPFTSSSAQFAQYRAFHGGLNEPTLCNVLNANMDACDHRSKDDADDRGWQLGAKVKKKKRALSQRGHRSHTGLSCVPLPWGNFSGLLAKHCRGTQCRRLRRISEVDAVHHSDYTPPPNPPSCM